MGRPNVVISGLTAAGKTTHALLLAREFGYDYVSATAIIADLVGVDRSEVGPGFWQRHGEEIRRLRDTTDLDRELDARLISLASSGEGSVIDAWALPWIIAPDSCVSVWIDSDHRSRTLKAAVSDEVRRPLNWYEQFISEKDDDSRDRFLTIYGFDLYGSRDRFTVQLDNSRLITEATRQAADIGIVAFQPVLSAAVRNAVTRLKRRTPEGVDEKRRSP